MLAELMSHIRRNSTPEESVIHLNLYQWTPDPANQSKSVLMPFTLKIPDKECVLSKVFDKFLACGSAEELRELLAPAGQLKSNEENVALQLMKQIGEILVMSGSHRVYICRHLSTSSLEPPIVRQNTQFRITDIWADSSATKNKVQNWAYNDNIKAQKVIKTSLAQVLIFLRAAAAETAQRLLVEGVKGIGTQEDLDAGRLRPFAKEIWKVAVKDDVDPTRSLMWKDYYNAHYINPTQNVPLVANSNDNYFQVMLESKVVFEKVIEMLQSSGSKTWGIGS